MWLIFGCIFGVRARLMINPLPVIKPPANVRRPSLHTLITLLRLISSLGFGNRPNIDGEGGLL